MRKITLILCLAVMMGSGPALVAVCSSPQAPAHVQLALAH
jgi:hypothetical protein